MDPQASYQLFLYLPARRQPNTGLVAEINPSVSHGEQILASRISLIRQHKKPSGRKHWIVCRVAQLTLRHSQSVEKPGYASSIRRVFGVYRAKQEQ